MPASFDSLPPMAQAALAATGTWLVTGLGALPVFWFRSAPPALALAAGAMLYVVVEELIPETVRAGSADSASLGFMLGFVIMMVLDNAFV